MLVLSSQDHVLEAGPPDLVIAQKVVCSHVFVLLQLVCESGLCFALANCHTLREKVALALNGLGSFGRSFVVSLNRLLGIHPLHSYDGYDRPFIYLYNYFYPTRI